jgi:hypothetical protein
MAFPLAHPAAVLPLRRIKWLSFPALVIGAVVPDLGYLFFQLDDFSHQALGSIVFGLPVGGLILAAFYGARTPVVARMPRALRRSVLPICERPLGPLWIAVLSLLIGIWTHVVWDSFTHNDGWVVEHLPILLTPVFEFGKRTARVCHLLWYGSSFVAVGWLFFAFEKWKQTAVTGPRGTVVRGKSVVHDAILLALLVVLISLVHHLIRSPIGFVMTGALCLFLGMLFIVRMATSTEKSAQ